MGPTIKVSLNGAPSQIKAPASASVYCSNDPTIEISTEDIELGSTNLPQTQGNAVRTFMLVAGEVAARWCNERGIPIVYRVTPRNPDKMDPAKFFIEHVRPSMDSKGNHDIHKLSAYFQFLHVQPSTTPGPHGAIGVDMMAKCTSPLRRFGDLLLHWQIEAALLEESRSGQSLVGNKRDDFLPFTKAEVDALLPNIDARERILSYGKRSGDRQWVCQFLVRAWLFKEAHIPSKLPFLVRAVDLSTKTISGTLTTYLTGAIAKASNDLDLAEIKQGDILETELVNVNVYRRLIEVKAVRYWDYSKTG
jgi:hypothetical protein